MTKTRDNQYNQAVGVIWGFTGVQVVLGGCLPFITGISYDHHSIYIDIYISYMFGSLITPTHMKK